MSRDVSRSSKLLSCAVIAGLLAAAIGSPSAASAQDEPPSVQNLQLQAIGGLIAGYAHTSYALVGTTADLYVNEAYDAERVKALMSETRVMQRNIIRMLRRLQGTALTREDDDFIDSAVSLFKLIDDEAALLIQFTESDDPEVGQKFEEVRLEIAKGMVKLFGGEAPPESAAESDADDTEAKKPDEKATDDGEKKPAEDVDEEN